MHFVITADRAIQTIKALAETDFSFDDHVRIMRCYHDLSTKPYPPQKDLILYTNLTLRLIREKKLSISDALQGIKTARDRDTYDHPYYERRRTIKKRNGRVKGYARLFDHWVINRKYKPAYDPKRLYGLFSRSV